MAKKQEDRTVVLDNGTVAKATFPVVVSASRSTDIPAFYSDWFFHRLNKGYSAWTNPFNGILTSSEIAELDLNNTDLVVLSTCQSALGEISKEGVFGLQRAFREAGAHSILMSLWNVDDYSTQLLMTEFYRHYLSGTSKLESLKKAQRYVCEYEDEEGNRLFEDPSYWAGFILLDALD